MDTFKIWQYTVKQYRLSGASVWKPLIQRKATFHLPTDPLRRVASDSEDVLGSGGRLLHGGVDRHLHVPVQERV